MTAAGRMCRSLAQPDAALRPLGMKKDNCAVILGLFELDGLEISMCTEFSTEFSLVQCVLRSCVPFSLLFIFVA